MLTDLTEGVLGDFAAFGAQRMTYGERACFHVERRRTWSEPGDFDIEDPAAMARAAARLRVQYAARSRLTHEHLERRRCRARQHVSTRPVGVRCLHCRRRVAQPLKQGRTRLYCDDRCRLEASGLRLTRCRSCNTRFEVPTRGGIKLFCTLRCRDRVANRKKRPPHPRAPRTSRLSTCGKPVTQPRTGKYREFCDYRCRQRHYYWTGPVGVPS